MEFRSFLNSDPPALARVWNAQPTYKQLAQMLSVAAFEHFVLAKPFFDRHGLMVAEADGHVVGFAHAGFGPTKSKSGVDETTGAICQVLLLPDYQSESAISGLLEAAENYLTQRGAKRVVAGPTNSLASFYHGLEANGDPLGVCDADEPLLDVVRGRHYQVQHRQIAMKRDLSGFRPIPNRQQRALSRTHAVHVDLEIDLSDWWELCRYGPIPCCGFHVVDKATKSRVGAATWWDQSILGVQSAVTFSDIEVSEPLRRNGVGTLLMNESMKKLVNSGANTAFATIDESNEVGRRFFESLGFKETARGTTFSKEV